MASPPDSPMRPALINTTNTHPEDATPFFTQPTTGKRATDDGDGGDKKRVKLSGVVEQVEEGDTSDSDSDVEMESDWDSILQARGRSVFGRRDAASAATSFTALRHTACKLCSPTTQWYLADPQHSVSTRPILESFVSSHKSDVYKCHSMDEASYSAAPYACAYSHGTLERSLRFLR